MSYWSEVSQKNLLPFSKEQSDFETALKEWEHTGVVVDHLYPVENCQLCEHANVRYHFEIINRETGAVLQVGSSCIEKFGITIYDEEGNKLRGGARGKKLKEEIKARQDEMMLEPLRRLWKVDEDSREKVAWYVQEYQERGGFPPKKLLYLFSQMNNEGIDYTPHIYKVTLRSKMDREHLYRISEAERKLIWGSLSTAQKKRYVKGKREFEEDMERKKEQERVEKLYSRPAPLPIPERRRRGHVSPHSTTYKSSERAPSLLDMPIRYSERAHRYKITFFDDKDKPLKRFFRGKLEKTRHLIKQKIADTPEYVKAEIRITQTNELLEIYP